jgi:hypothetical protein
MVLHYTSLERCFYQLSLLLDEKLQGQIGCGDEDTKHYAEEGDVWPPEGLAQGPWHFSNHTTSFPRCNPHLGVKAERRQNRGRRDLDVEAEL